MTLNNVSKTILLFCVLHLSLQSNGQQSVKDSSISATVLDFSFAQHIPGGDMGERFFTNSSLGFSVNHKFENNTFITANYSFIFRDQVKEDSILNSISTSSGFVIDGNGQFAEYFLFERGFMTSISFGKLFPIYGPNPNSGFFISGGCGIMQHKIKIQHLANTAPQIRGDYQKGYDRLSNGFMLTQMVGYRLLSNNRLVNGMFGIEFNQAFTKNRRDINFDTQQKDTSKRLDLLSGIRFGISLPLYRKVPKDFYFY
jgi:hypothetical protein